MPDVDKCKHDLRALSSAYSEKQTKHKHKLSPTQSPSTCLNSRLRSTGALLVGWLLLVRLQSDQKQKIQTVREVKYSQKSLFTVSTDIRVEEKFLVEKLSEELFHHLHNQRLLYNSARCCLFSRRNAYNSAGMRHPAWFIS